MQREIENDGCSAMAVSKQSKEPPIDQELWEAWQDEVVHELGLILERLEAL